MAGGRIWTLMCVAGAGLALAVFGVVGPADGAPTQSTQQNYRHEGVASCGGSTCHGRQEPTGAVVRQNELLTWQEPSSPAGAHSRAYQLLLEPRSQAIAAKLGIGPANQAPMCLGCHADNPPPALRGARFDITQGVGCESCHGGSQQWLSSHYAVGATHASNVAMGMYPLSDPKKRAERCLDCHFGSAGQGQFVTHRIMAAGHPRVSFELDLFTALQRHHDEDADYRRRKQTVRGVKTWAIGQAMALDRATALYATPRGQDGAFPEFYFFDCRTCHRNFSDDPGFRPADVANPGRPSLSGFPTFNDENIIMLAAAARIAAPTLAAQLTTQSRAFHAAFASDRATAVRAAGQLGGTARALAAAFENASFSNAQTLSILEAVLAQGQLYTDYQGAQQAVMAADTLISDLQATGGVGGNAAKLLRGDLDRAYAAVRTPEGFKPAEFRATTARLAAGVRGLR
ncbi:multiheme c-type cytochrome [Sphingoaurantiacus capsulatus]|uniref:Multiheme c-type cytochrome n=1 Tax=Sphingoaurantiacus capsulatus TaxID=1771310 RepID=A0ABV7XAQ5_9SPHN